MDTSALEAFKSSTIRPDDFDDFWDRTLAQVDQLPLNASVEPVALRSTSEVEVYEVHYDSWVGVRIAGWYCLPAKRSGKLPAVLHVPGYIGEPPIPKESARQGYAAFSVAPRGKLRSNSQFNPGYPGLLTHNIVDRNTYGYRGFYLDAARAFDFLAGRDEVDATRIGVRGSSQGGGLTLAVAGLRSQTRAASAGVPYLCGFMDSIELTHTYPYQEIRDYLHLYPDRTEDVRQTVAYFDGINFGPRITCPIIVNVGLQDNVCPPETGYAAFKTIASTEKVFYPYDGHGHDGGGAVAHNAIIDSFFRRHLQS